MIETLTIAWEVVARVLSMAAILLIVLHFVMSRIPEGRDE